MSRRLIPAWIGLTCTLLLAGCAASDPSPVPDINPREPDWVYRTPSFAGPAGRGFYGLGNKSGIRDAALARTYSERKAREALLPPFLEELVGLAAPAATPERRSSLLAEFTASARACSQAGAKRVEEWKDPGDGSLYSLLFLDLDVLVRSLEDQPGLEAHVRARLAPAAAEALQAAEARLDAPSGAPR